jgi:hypothetical protein
MTFRPEITRTRPVYNAAKLYDRLELAIDKYGYRRGYLKGIRYHQALRGLRYRQAPLLDYVNPYAPELWERCLREAITFYGLETGPLLFTTIIDQTWHFGWRRWALDIDKVKKQAQKALRGTSYLFLIEIGPLEYFGHRYVAPHLQGFVFQDLSRRKKERISSHFAGGLGGAPALVTKRVYDFDGASRYNVKPPTHVDVCYRLSNGERRHPGRDLSLSELF